MMAKTYTVKEINFGIFIIHRLAESWRKPVPETYRILKNTNILDGYVLNCYDTLHTLGEQYLVEDITEFAREEGASV
jgi:hypothetical protein